MTTKIKDKKLLQYLDAYCIITGTKQSDYILQAVKDKLQKDLKSFKVQEVK